MAKISYGLVMTVCMASAALAAADGSCGLPPARWISGDTAEAEKSAPMLLKAFVLAERPREATLAVAFAGWGEVYVNGVKAGRDVLAPVTCQPDRRISSKDFDVAPLLRAGRNEIEILLGNGWFNHFTRSAWGFDSAPWRSCPKTRAELRVDGKTALVTDGAWTAYDSPIVFNSLRNGERYDARLEGRRDNARSAKVEKYAPLGYVSPEDAAPCREGDARLRRVADAVQHAARTRHRLRDGPRRFAPDPARRVHARRPCGRRELASALHVSRLPLREGRHLGRGRAAAARRHGAFDD